MMGDARERLRENLASFFRVDVWVIELASVALGAVSGGGEGVHVAV